MNKVRLIKEEINKIRTLIQQGKSLNEISSILGKSKTTVYYHFRKIKGRTFNPIILNSNNKELIGEFIGLFAGDGCVHIDNYRHRVFLYFNITEKFYVKNLIQTVLIKLFGKEPMIIRPDNRLNLCYYSKEIYELINNYLVWDKNFRKTYSVRLIKNTYSKQFVIGFLRGCLDSDGYLSKEKISFATVSKGLMKNITNFLKELQIEYSVNLYKEKRINRKDIYHINVLKNDYNKFMNIIRPRNLKGLYASAGIRTPEC